MCQYTYYNVRHYLSSVYCQLKCNTITGSTQAGTGLKFYFCLELQHKVTKMEDFYPLFLLFFYNILCHETLSSVYKTHSVLHVSTKNAHNLFQIHFP